MEDERHPEQTPSLDPQSVEIARLLKQEQEHQTEIAHWQSKTVQLEKKAVQLEKNAAQLEKKAAQLEKKTLQLEEELAQLKKTSGAGRHQQDEATLTQGSPDHKLPPQKQRRGSLVENLAGE